MINKISYCLNFSVCLNIFCKPPLLFRSEEVFLSDQTHKLFKGDSPFAFEKNKLTLIPKKKPVSVLITSASAKNKSLTFFSVN